MHPTNIGIDISININISSISISVSIPISINAQLESQMNLNSTGIFVLVDQIVCFVLFFVELHPPPTDSSEIEMTSCSALCCLSTEWSRRLSFLYSSSMPARVRAGFDSNSENE
jgi:hypothetical protein